MEFSLNLAFACGHADADMQDAHRNPPQPERIGKPGQMKKGKHHGNNSWKQGILITCNVRTSRILILHD